MSGHQSKRLNNVLKCRWFIGISTPLPQYNSDTPLFIYLSLPLFTSRLSINSCLSVCASLNRSISLFLHFTRSIINCVFFSISLFLHFTLSITLCVFFLYLSVSPFHTFNYTVLIFSQSLSFSIYVLFVNWSLYFPSLPFSSLSIYDCLYMSLLLHLSVSPFLCVFYISLYLN